MFHYYESKKLKRVIDVTNPGGKVPPLSLLNRKILHMTQLETPPVQLEIVSHLICGRLVADSSVFLSRQ
jgi:hypothetical protein